MSIVKGLAQLGLVAGLKAKAEKSVHRIVITAAVGGFAVLLLLVALGFLAFAGFLALVPEVGPIGAALVTAGLTLLLALIVLWIGIPGTRPGFLRRRPKRSTSVTPTTSATALTAFATGFLTGRSSGKGSSKR